MKHKKDLGMTFEEAIKRPDFFNCYEFLGKFYTNETFDTAPEVQIDQCPICGEFSWEEEETVDRGKCNECGFVG